MLVQLLREQLLLVNLTPMSSQCCYLDRNEYLPFQLIEYDMSLEMDWINIRVNLQVLNWGTFILLPKWRDVLRSEVGNFLSIIVKVIVFLDEPIFSFDVSITKSLNWYSV